jgi:hypothetical protein
MVRCVNCSHSRIVQPWAVTALENTDAIGLACCDFLRGSANSIGRDVAAADQLRV